MPATGQVGILNVGAGDTKLSFDPNNPADMIRAARIVKDMVRRGYALLVQVGQHENGEPKYQRAYDFDEAKCEYIIADLDPVAAERADREENKPAPAPNAVQAEDQAGATAAETPRRRGRPPTKRVHASTTRTVAVARTAGG